MSLINLAARFATTNFEFSVTYHYVDDPKSAALYYDHYILQSTLIQGMHVSLHGEQLLVFN